MTVSLASPAFLRRVSLEIAIQKRAGFYLVYIFMTMFFFSLLFLVPESWRARTLGLIILMDPSFMGFFFAGALVLLEKDQGVLSVLQTQGHGFADYWRQKITSILVLALSVVTVLCVSAALFGFVSPTIGGLLRLLLGLFLGVPVFYSFGLAIAGRFPRILDYFLWSSMLMMPFMFPFLEFFGVSVSWFGILSPVWGPMILISSAFESSPDLPVLIVAVVSLVGWNILAYRLGRKGFHVLSGSAVQSRQATDRAFRRSEALHTASRRTVARRKVTFGSKFLPADLYLLLRDPVSLAILAGPFMMVAVLGRGLPYLLQGPLSPHVPEHITAAVLGAMDHIRSFSLLVSALMYGMLGAFLFLDEKDEGVLPFLKTLPARRGWYLLRRCGLLWLLFAVFLVPLVLAGDLLHASLPVFLFSLVLDALILPLVFLGIGIIAANKVQGLAMAKLFNVCCLPPLAIAVIPAPYSWLLGIFPTAWGSLLRLSASDPWQILVTAAAGFLYTGGCVYFLYRKALRQ
ncbi:fluoroquinolone export ABC transporter permease subunit [Spirochaeta dissipatitropha]